MPLADYLPIPAETPQFLAGLLMLVVAGVVLAVRFDAKVNRALALFLVLAGFANLGGALDDTPAVSNLVLRLSPYFGLTMGVALVYFALRFREVEEGRALSPALLAALLAIGIALPLLYAYDGTLFAGQGTRGPLFVLGWSGIVPLLAALVALHFVRRARLAALTSSAQAFSIAALAFGLEAAYHGGLALGAGRFLPAGSTWGTAASLTRVAIVIPILAATHAAWRLGRPGRGVAAGLTVASLSGLVLGLAYSTSDPWPSIRNAVNGMWQVAAPLLLAYAILRHQLLGLDVKVRWGISKSALAAVFIAVFFVASEAAQEFFGETLGSSYVGIVAAGLLVFAIAPLTRVADSLAARAVPVAEPSPPPASDDHRTALFRRAARHALADGRLTPEEETYLAELAQELGLGPADALRIRREFERAGDGGAR